MRVSTTFGNPLPDRKPEQQTSGVPFRILVLGDFGASESFGKPVTVDRDELDDVVGRLGVSFDVELDAGAPPVTVSVSELEDFHPDRLFENLELFAALRTRRRRLQNEATFQEEADAIRSSGLPPSPTESESEGSATEPAPETSPMDAASLLDQAVADTAAAQQPLAEQIAGGNLNLDDYVRRLVEPYVLQKADPRQAEFIASVDDAIAGTMRKLLHHPRFQQIEAAWQGVRMLCRHLETDAKLQVSLLNVPREALAGDLSSDDDLSKSGLYKLLVDSMTVAGAEPFTLVLGDYSFDAAAESTDLLGRIARIHAAAGAVFVASAAGSVVGCPDYSESPDPDDWIEVTGEAAERWASLRAMPETASVALLSPRMLGRRAYGKRDDPIESFAFEELPEGFSHADYLWMNPAFGAVTLLGQAFSAVGWSVTGGYCPSLDRLPVHLYKEAGESVVKPCGEIELVLRGGERIRDAGLSPVYSVRDQGEVRIPLPRALSSATEALAARWS